MARFAEPLGRLVDELRKLPGVGSRSAQRLAFHLLRTDEDDAFALADAIRQVKAELHLCTICNNITDVDPCLYCASPTRNQRMVCVVEEPTNVASVEKTHYNGVYHVLHGTLSPLHGVAPEHLRAKTLLERAARGELEEVILALSPTTEGEATSVWLAEELESAPVKVTRIATGVPAGSDIEYVDEVTIRRAMEGRREMR